MSKSNIFKKRVIYSLVTTVMATASQGGFAHTRLESPTILEGSSGVLAHNRVTIGHGCPPITARNPSYGTSVVFPNAISYSPIIGVDGSSAGKGTAKQYATNQDASTYYAPLAGIGARFRMKILKPMPRVILMDSGRRESLMIKLYPLQYK